MRAKSKFTFPLRFRLRTLLVVMTCLCVLLSLLVLPVRAYFLEQQTIRESKFSLRRYSQYDIENSMQFRLGWVSLNGGCVTTDYFGPPLLKTYLLRSGLPVFDRVVAIELHGPDVNDSIADITERFPCLRSVALNRTSVSQKWIDEFRQRHPACKIDIVAPVTLQNAG